MTIIVRQANELELEAFDLPSSLKKHHPMAIIAEDELVLVGGIQPCEVGFMAWTKLDPELFKRYAKSCTRAVRAYVSELDSDVMSVFMNARTHKEVEWGKLLGFNPLTPVFHPETGDRYWLLKLRTH